jgi:hypothetical protein
MDRTDIKIAESSAEELIGQLSVLPLDVQLRRVLEFLSTIDEYTEQLAQLTSQVWAYLVQNELWKAGSMTLEEVKAIINWPEVCKRIVRYQETQKRKSRDGAGIQKHWSCLASEALPKEIRPTYMSANLLRHLYRLSKICPELERAQTLLRDTMKGRLQKPGSYKMAYILAVDVTRAIEQAESVKEGGDGSAVADAARSDDKGTKGNSTEQIEQQHDHEQRKYKEEGCSCPASLRGLFPRPGIRLTDSEGLALLEQAQKGVGLCRLCHRHLRLLAAGGFGLYNNKGQEVICRRLNQVYRYRSKLAKLRQRNPGWFRRSQRGVMAQDVLGIYRYEQVKEADFDFEAMQVFERFAGVGSWEEWQRDGTINIPGVFSYLEQAGLRGMIDEEFAIYRHHYHALEGKPRLGWLRNMYYSLIQQLARQDPVWYALTAAARPDRGWRLVSYPYITKDTDAGGETTGFLHMDLDVSRYIADGRGGSRLSSSLSVDDEEMDGCTVVVKGMQRHIGAWYSRLLQRGWKGCGRTTNCNSSTYTAEDRKEWGEVVGVPCRAWGVRITLPQIIHGSTARSVRRRRTVLPWFMQISADHEQLEVEGCVGWSELRRCHLDLEVPRRDPSGYGPGAGVGMSRFGGSVVLGSSSALGDALVGRRKWTDPEVKRERNVLLGADARAAAEYVWGVRSRMVEQYRVAFQSMVRTEREQFGQQSYFAGVRGKE